MSKHALPLIAAFCAILGAPWYALAVDATAPAQGMEDLSPAEMDQTVGRGVDYKCPDEDDCCLGETYGNCGRIEADPTDIPCGEHGGVPGSYMCLRDYEEPVRKCVRVQPMHVCCVGLGGGWYWDVEVDKWFCYCDQTPYLAEDTECALVAY